MTKYHLSYTNPEKHFLTIQVARKTEGKDNLTFQLPAWRPGRYELGNFAKNVKDFSATNEKGEVLFFSKRSKDSWFVDCKGSKEVTITYLYYANELNAGSTFLDESQLYVNPVNCLMYEVGTENEPCTMSLNIPNGHQMAHSLEEIKLGEYRAVSFHEIVDSPFVVSPSLQHNSYESHGVKFHIWFQGEVKPQWDKLLKDFKLFTDFQMDKFGSIPAKEYHFIFQITHYTSYHGVEHFKSTVIQLGPSYEVFEKLYTELLGVSSHELYHVWNVKAIRPVEMFPYDYSRENYSRLGYVAEGVTTYMGDRILFESGVFDETQYNKEILNYILRHFHNDGRFHTSVADSSFDTWLDGYVQGVPGRKSSIYVEGCLVAYMCDMRIRKSTDNRKSLHDVMVKMYELTNQRVGYTDTIYQETLELIGGISFKDIFEKYIYGTECFWDGLKEAFSFEAKELCKEVSLSALHQIGIKGAYVHGAYELKQVLENSSAFKDGVVEGDFIHGVNGITVLNDLDHWFKYFEGDEIAIQVKRNGHLKNIQLSKPNDFQFYNYLLK